MMNTEREEQILNLLKDKGEVAVSTLPDLLYVSEATVRRTLKRLEEKGLIIRKYGKAVLVNGYADKNTSYALRENFADKIKDKLSEVAVSECAKDGNVVFLDASSTAMATVKYLDKLNDVIVITSGIKTLVNLSQTSIKFYSTGGLAVERSLSLVGQTAINTVNSFNADVCFVSCHALSKDGFATDTSVAENDLRTAILNRSKRKVLLIDGSKINDGCWHNLCHVSLFDDVFCNTVPPENVLSSIKNFHLVKI